MTEASRRPALRELAEEGGGLLVSLPLWAWWAVWKGGYPPTVFLAGIAYLALAAIAMQLFARRARFGGASGWALALFAGLGAWALVSMLWADDRGAAEIASARQILLLASFALPIMWPPSARALVAGLFALPLIALCGAISALGAALGDAATLVDGRLTGPTGYPNASGALMACGILPALVLGSRRELGASVRTVSLAAAGALLGSLVLTQSRGALGALALALLLAFLVLPGRLRLAIAVAIVAVAVAPTLPSLLDVHAASVDGGDVAASLRRAVSALCASTVVLAALAALYAFVDARAEIPERTVRRASAVTAGTLVAVGLAGIAVLLATGPNVGDWISERFEDFKTPDYVRLESEPSRFTGGLGSHRYDYWRVATQVFADEPVTGSGADNFIAPYLERRHGSKSTIYPHSIWLAALAELGAVGLLLLVGFLVAVFLALARSARGLGERRWIVVAASLPLVYVLLHGSADWIDAFPLISAPPLALAGAAAVVAGSAGERRQGRRSVTLAIAIAIAFAAILAMPLLVAARLADRGFASWQQRPAGAIDDLERAADLDPLSATPYVRLGVVAIDLERPGLARRAFRETLARDGTAWYPELQLGLLDARVGDRAAALRRLQVALQRNPREPAVRSSLRSVRAGRAPDPRTVQARVLEGGE